MRYVTNTLSVIHFSADRNVDLDFNRIVLEIPITLLNIEDIPEGESRFNLFFCVL